MARKSWWTNSQVEQLAIMVNTLAKISGHQVALGLTNAEMTRIQELCTTYIEVHNYVESCRETTGSLVEWRDDYFYRPGGGAPPPTPVFAGFSNPGNAAAGTVTEFKGIRDQIVNTVGFPEAIGDDLMWLGSEFAKPIANTVVPSVSATPAATGYLASIVVSGREESDGWELWILDKGAANWVKFDRFTGKSVDVTFTPTTPGEPYQFQIRVQLRKNNANYGQPSDAITITVNP